MPHTVWGSLGGWHSGYRPHDKRDILRLVVRAVMPDDVQPEHGKTQSTGDIVSVVQVVTDSSQHPHGPSCPRSPYRPLRKATSDNHHAASSSSSTDGRRSPRPPTSLHRPKSPTSGGAGVTFNGPGLTAAAAVATPRGVVELPSSAGDHGFSACDRPKSLPTLPQTVESLAALFEVSPSRGD